MIKLAKLQPGDIVMAEYEGQQTEGVVKEINKDIREVCVETDVQEFWFKPEDLYPIPLNEAQLLKLGFDRQEHEDGSVKYGKGPFRVFLPHKEDFNTLEIWYREDRRHLHEAIYVHELQNHYYQMTKVELNPA